MLHKGNLWLFRKLSLGQRLCWDNICQPMPRPQPIQLLLFIGHRLRWLCCTHNPGRWRLQVRGRQWCPENCQRLSRKNKEHWMHQILCLSRHFRSLLWQGYGYDVLGCWWCKYLISSAPRILTLPQVPTTSGRQIAEWVMNNRGTLNLKYVIWGQRIWSPTQDAVGAWTTWRVMEDRGDVTQNHW